MIKEISDQSNTTEFIIQGFSEIRALNIAFFVIFLIIYLLIILGNLTTFAVIWADSHLHSPMYIFLMNFSLLDIFYTSTILPKLLAMLVTNKKTISFVGCMIQMHFFMSFACSEFLLLAVMAYDRYIAICHPLHYVLHMSVMNCALFITFVWSCGLLDPVGHTIITSQLSFCSSHNIEHFFCDISPLLKLSCSGTSDIDILNYVEGTLLTLSALILTLVSYIFIISTILHIQSSEGRHKAFSTCASHLTCVILFYGTVICLYLRPTSSYSPKQDKFFALLYIVLIPLLNPIIYTLKNKEFQDGFMKLRKSIFFTVAKQLHGHKRQ